MDSIIIKLKWTTEGSFEIDIKFETIYIICVRSSSSVYRENHKMYSWCNVEYNSATNKQISACQTNEVDH